MGSLRVGGVDVDFIQAQRWVHEYLVGSPGESAYPAYDGYEGSGRTNPELGDADLLAPVLLNVSQNPVPTYYSLKALTPALNDVLGRIPLDFCLQDADDQQIDVIAQLYRVLDDDPRFVGLTTLSKVLARKRPGLIPVFDRAVAHCYSVCDGAPVPYQASRSRSGYAHAWLNAVRDDLQDTFEAWFQLASMAPEDQVPISPLRALDIVAWRAGLPAVLKRRGRRAAEVNEAI